MNNQILDFYTIRHGKTHANSVGVKMCGSTDSHLSEEGKSICIQARKMCGFNFDSVHTVICSTLARTKETAEIMFDDILQRNNTEISFDADFNEIDFGEYEMTEKKELPEDILSKWENSPQTLTFPNGDNMSLRADMTLKKLIKICENTLSPFIIVSSCTILRLLFTRMKNMPLSDFHKIRMNNCEITHIRYNRKEKTFSFPE